MQWAEDTYDDTIAFWIYFFVDKDEQGIVADKESKSLCYVPVGVGCFMPYEEKFKPKSPIYALPNTSSKTLGSLDKNDIVFAIAKSSDEKFYQVIVYPQMVKVKESLINQGNTTDALHYMKSITPVNGFVKKSAIKCPISAPPIDES